MIYLYFNIYKIVLNSNELTVGALVVQVPHSDVIFVRGPPMSWIYISNLDRLTQRKELYCTNRQFFKNKLTPGPGPAKNENNALNFDCL